MSSSPAQPIIQRQTALFCLLALAVGLAIYLPGAHGGFLLDDYVNLVNNPALHVTSLRFDQLTAAAFSSGSGPLGRPLSMLSFALNEYFWGPGPYSMKATNIVIHLVNGALLYLLTALLLSAYRRRFAPSAELRSLQWISVTVVAAWVLLPLNLTGVLYVIQRMTSLSATFVLAGLALYVYARLRLLDGVRTLWLLWLAIVLFGGLAVLAKESGALLPVYAFVVELTLFRFAHDTGRGYDYRLFVLFGVLLALPAAVGLWHYFPHGLDFHATLPRRSFSMAERLLSEPRVLLGYIDWALLPNLHSLSLYHDDYVASSGLLHPPSTLLAIIAVAASLGVAAWQRNRRALLSLGILWFFAGHLLTASVFNLELAYEHRNYLPSFGLLLALFSLLLERPQRLPRARRIAAVCLIGIYAAITAARVHQWANPIRFAEISAAEHPNSPRATYVLGRTYAVLVTGESSPFLPLANAALEKAARAPGASILPEQGLIITNAQHGQPLKNAWWTSMQKKLLLHPLTAQDLAALDSLVWCEMRKFCQLPKEKMIRTFGVALRRNPDKPKLLAVFTNYALNVLHDYAGARALAAKAIQLDPKNPQYRINLFRIEVFLRRFGDARATLNRVRAMNRFGALDTAIAAMERRLHDAKKLVATPSAEAKRQAGPTPDSAGGN